MDRNRIVAAMRPPPWGATSCSCLLTDTTVRHQRQRVVACDLTKYTALTAANPVVALEQHDELAVVVLVVQHAAISTSCFHHSHAC